MITDERLQDYLQRILRDCSTGAAVTIVLRELLEEADRRDPPDARPAALPDLLADFEERLRHLVEQPENWKRLAWDLADDIHAAAALTGRPASHPVADFLDRLGGDFPAPEIALEADGDLLFEWYVDKETVLSVSLRASGLIQWASLFPDGPKCGHFTLPEWPADWKAALDDVLAGRPASVSAPLRDRLDAIFDKEIERGAPPIAIVIALIVHLEELAMKVAAGQ